MPTTAIPEAQEIYEQGLEYHRRRCVTDAGQAYQKTLDLEPCREPSAAEVELMLRHAPRIFTTPTEPLPLKDFAAILHPTLPLIGYHFFWEDDIDFPLDRDPCDHEVIWVMLDDERRHVKTIYTYYHSFVLSAPEAVTDAEAHGGRPRVEVQWGKHGSLPVGWQQIGEEAVWRDMQETYERLHTVGCRDAGHPLAQNWPTHFEGTWDEFIDFSQEVDGQVWLRKKGMMQVGICANAIIFWRFLRYNFCPKYSWPDLAAPGQGLW